MSTEHPTKEKIFTEVKGYIVVDKDGDFFDMKNLSEAQATAARWNAVDPELSPHRVCEVIWREVTP